MDHWHLTVLYFITTLLRCNSHTIQFTCLKCIIHWFLVYSQNCPTTNTIDFRTFSLISEVTPYSLTITPYSHLLPDLATTNLPSVSILDTPRKWNHTVCDFLCLVLYLAYFQDLSCISMSSLLWPNHILLYTYIQYFINPSSDDEHLCCF